MPDLGLSQLQDDQLVNLLNEAVTELLARDPFVQRAASNARQQIAEKYKITAQEFHAIAKSEVASAGQSYLAAVRQDVKAEVARAIGSGELNIGQAVGRDAETKVIVECTKEQIAAIKADLKREPENSSFTVSYNGRDKSLKCSYHSAGQNWDANRNLTLNAGLREQVRKAVLGAFGLPTD